MNIVKEEISDKIFRIFEWASNTSVSELESFFSIHSSNFFVFVGTGGSFVVSNFLRLILENQDINSTSLTPMIFLQRGIKQNDYVILFSSGGSNPDSIEVVRTLSKHPQNKSLIFTLSPNSPVSILSENHNFIVNYSKYGVFNLKSFVAIEGLIAPILLLAKALQINIDSIVSGLLKNLDSSDFHYFEDNFDSIFVLHGRNGEPAALNLEYKISKAALSHFQKADYRSFAHGRYNYLNSFQKTLVIAIFSVKEKEVAFSTLKLIPKNINCISIESDLIGSNSIIDLLLKSFILIEELGKTKNINLEKVPESAHKFGNELYKGGIWDERIFRNIYFK